MRNTLIVGLAGMALTSVACSGSEDDIARSGAFGDGSAEASDEGTGGRSTGGRSTGSGGRRATGGRVGTGGRPSSGGAVASGGLAGSGGLVSSGGVAGSGGIVASGGASGSGGTTDAGVPDARDSSADAGSMDSTTSDASVGDAGEAGSDTGRSDAGVVPFAIDLVFDETGGQNTYFGLNQSNWSGDPQYVLPHAGNEAMMSANGNATGTFPGIGFAKVLGGTIENRPYRVSFWVVQYYPGLSGIQLSDFNVLRIGGPGGTMIWNDTPVPSVVDQWVKWTGTYTPSLSDVGQPFRFEARFNLDGMHSIGIDGPIVAEPL